MQCEKAKSIPPVSYMMLKDDELPKLTKLHRDVYVQTMERASRWHSIPEAEESFGAFVGGEMVAGLSVMYYRIRLAGKVLPMGGVGGVATQPEHRHRHHVARLLDLALRRMRERDIPVSMLYPFKYAFYRKYGWEHAGDSLRLILPMRSLASLREVYRPTEEYRFVRVPVPADGAEGLETLALVYQNATSEYNCSVVRDREWERIAAGLRNTEADGRNVYIYLGLCGEKPVSYVIYSFTPS